MTQEILSALKAIEDKLIRTPTAFNWTPAMSAVFPVRLTMSQLLAIWDALHDGAVYEAPKPLEAQADPDGWIANDNLARPEWLRDDVMIDVKIKYLDQVIKNVRALRVSWGDFGPSTITHWRYHK